MFSWSLLLALAPDLVPLIVKAILDVEQTIRGIGRGLVKKEKVMDIIRAVMQTKDYFVGSDSAKQLEIFTLVEQAIDFLVSAFNYLGLFKTSKKVSFQPKPAFEEVPSDDNT